MVHELETVHIPVLLEEVLVQLGTVANKTYIDGTFGGGGYSAALLSAGARVIGVDQDETALARGAQLVAQYPEKITLVHANFAQLAQVAEQAECPAVDGVVLDLGISSDQLDDPARGLTFRQDGPLDMRLDQKTEETAADILNTYPEAVLVKIFREYGDEPKAGVLARKISQIRKETPFVTTGEFLKLIEQLYPARAQQRAHPAGRIFQALRIHINQELKALEEVLPQARDLLKPGGKLCVVTFHSLEDRVVKRFMRDQCQPVLDSIGRQIDTAPYHQPVKKIVPTAAEIEANPRAKSAHLRVLERRAA